MAKNSSRTFRILLPILLVCASAQALNLDFKLGALSLEDKRFIYPNNRQFNIPVGTSLDQHNGAVTVEPRLNFIRNHDENCIYNIRGHFDNHDEVFWFCANTDKTKPGEIRIANPEVPGKKEKIDFKAVPSKDDFVLIVPLTQRKDAVIVAKTSTAGTYDLYTKAGKVDKQLVTGDATFNDPTKLRAIIAPKTSKKDKDIYFYMENVEGATNIYQYVLGATTPMKKIEMKKKENLGEEFTELKKMMHLTVSETYISMTCVLGDKTNQLKFAFFEWDDKAASQIWKNTGKLTFRDIPQENGKTEVSETALAWAYKTVAENADVLIFNKTPKDKNLKPYVQFGYAVKATTETDKVNDHLKTYTFDKEHDVHKNYEISTVHMSKNLVRFAWRDPTSKDIKTVWETRWGNKQHIIAMTKAELPENMKELIFVYPSYIIAINKHFEYNYHHFNFVFNPKKMPESKREFGTTHNFEIEVTSPHTSDYEVHKLNIKYQVVDSKQLKTYSQEDKNKASISAIKGTLIEFQVPEINFRGNNIKYEADMKGNGIMIAQNNFQVVPEIKGDQIQLLDDLYGQSIIGKKYRIHKCDMVITNDINVKCAKAAKDVEYSKGDLKQLAQVNSLHGIYSVFESKDPKNDALIPVVEYIKKTHDKDESLKIKEIDIKKELGGKSDLVNMGVSGKKVTIFAVKGGKVFKKEIDDLEGSTVETFDITEYIPSFKGKTCTPKEISKSDFYDDNNVLISRAFVTYECDGIKTIVDWRNKLANGKPNIKEVMNYQGTNDVKTCVTRGGFLEMDTKKKTLQIRTLKYGEIIDYAMGDYDFKSLDELICDHPGEGHALIKGVGNDNKTHFMMINLNVRDPLGLVYHKFEMPVAKVGEIHSSRYMNYFLLTFTEEGKTEKKYLLLNPGDKEIRVKAQDKPYDIIFKATGHSKSTKKQFQLTMTIQGQDLKTTTVEQFNGQFTDFNEKKRYDLDNYLKYTGPVKSVDVIIPEKLKEKVTYNNSANKNRIEVLQSSPQNPDITIVIPSAQITRLVQSDGIYLMFRSNEFETEVKEIYQGVNEQFIYYVQEPCEDISFDSKSGKGTVVLSCPKSSDIIFHTEKVGTGKVKKVEHSQVRLMSPSTSSSVTHISEGISVIARTAETSDSEVTIQIDKVDASKAAPKGQARRYITPLASATIDACAIYSAFNIGDRAAIAYSNIFSDRISLKLESGKDKTTGKAKFTTYDLVRGDALKGVVSRLGCQSFDGKKENQKIVNCWAYTNENMVYLFKVDSELSTDGELHLNNIFRNFYNTGKEQYITGCAVSDEFLVCSSDNLSSEKSRERTSVLVFRIYNTTTWKNYYEYAKLLPSDLKDVTPFISTLTFLPKTSRRVLSDVFDERAYWEQRHRFLGRRMLADTPKEYVQQSLSIFGAYSDGVKRHTFKVSPTSITTNVKDLAKTNADDLKNIEVKVTGLDGKNFSYKLGSLKKDTKADPVVPDEKRDKKSSSNSDEHPDANKGIGFFGWFMIVVFLGAIVAGAWYFVRREQLKNEAREKMIEDAPEMESYD